MTRKLLIALAIIFALGFVFVAQAQDEGEEEDKAEEKAEKDDEADDEAEEEEDKAEEENEDKEDVGKDEAKPEKAALAPAKKAAPAKQPVASTGNDSEPHVFRSLALYIPNRIFDALDIFSITLGAGPEFRVQAQCTRFCGFMGRYGERYYLSKGYRRQLGGAYGDGWLLMATCISREYTYVEDTFGTMDEYVVDAKDWHIAVPADEVYAEGYEDCLAIGAGAGWLINTTAEVHPTEILDLITGIFFIDMMNDDFEHTAIYTCTAY